MAHTDSAKRHVRADEKRRIRNRAIKATIWTFEKKFLKFCEEGKVQEAQAALIDCSSQFDKAAKKGTIKKNTAARKKSRLALQLNKLSAAAAK